MGNQKPVYEDPAPSGGMLHAHSQPRAPSLAHGSLAGIARRGARRAPMELVVEGVIDPVFGLYGDAKGRKFAMRQITILAAEDWDAALASIAAPALPWTARRANLLVRGLILPRARGALLRIGEACVEATGQTYPCGRMEEAYPGLLRALAPNWRGGLTCRVTQGGTVRLGDAVEVLVRPPDEKPPTLP